MTKLEKKLVEAAKKVIDASRSEAIMSERVIPFTDFHNLQVAVFEVEAAKSRPAR